MSTSGIASSSLWNYDPQSVQNKFAEFRQEFQQLGEDLQSGNLSAAQQDFATLQQDAPQGSPLATQKSNSVTQDFSQLAQDLQSGNLSGAQQDFAQIQQDFQNQAQSVHHHHHHGGGSDQSQMAQLFSQLGQDLQSGNLTSAQQVYQTLQQDFQQFSGSGSQSTQQSSNSISVNA